MKKHNLKTVGRPLKYPAGFKAIGQVFYVSVGHKDAGQLMRISTEQTAEMNLNSALFAHQTTSTGY